MNRTAQDVRAPSAPLAQPRALPLATGSDSAAPADPTDDPQYQAWVESMAKHCRCRSSDVPCAGVLAGGMCDEIDDSADMDDDYDEAAERCPQCRGSGQYDDATPCPYCDGDGTLPW